MLCVKCIPIYMIQKCLQFVIDKNFYRMESITFNPTKDNLFATNIFINEHFVTIKEDKSIILCYEINLRKINPCIHRDTKSIPSKNKYLIPIKNNNKCPQIS